MERVWLLERYGVPCRSRGSEQMTAFRGRDSLSRETGVAAIGGMPARKRQSMSRLSPRLALLLLPTPVHSVMLGPHRSLGPCFFQLISSLLKYQAEKMVQTTHRVYEFS